MKIHELLSEIQRNLEIHEDFLDFDIYTEQLDFNDKMFKRGQKPFISHDGTEYYSSWETIKDSEDWEFFKTHGFNHVFKKEKIFTINVNY